MMQKYEEKAQTIAPKAANHGRKLKARNNM